MPSAYTRSLLLAASAITRAQLSVECTAASHRALTDIKHQLAALYSPPAVNVYELKEYEQYFDACERANIPPMPYDDWLAAKH